MTIVHHPEDAVLVSYASGAADEATALVIATHLALCPDCRDTVARAEAAGGALLETVAPVATGSLDAVLARLAAQDERPALRPPLTGMTPEPLRSYLRGELADVPWRKVTGGISEYGIVKRGKSVARMLKVTPGTAVSEHTHSGDEITLILAGGLGDHTGEYHCGDVQSMTSEDTHVPTALPGEDCIVLAVTDGPLRFSNPMIAAFARLMRF